MGQKWIDVLSNEYPENESAIQNLHGGGKGGKQVKLITGECAGTIIELFFDTGMIVIKGKSPNFLRWATSKFNGIKSKVENVSNPCQNTVVKNIACRKSETGGDTETLSHKLESVANMSETVCDESNTLDVNVKSKTVCETSKTLADEIETVSKKIRRTSTSC